MPEPALMVAPLLPTVSIVEETMRQARRAVAFALAGAALMTLALLGERLWSSNELERAADRHAQAHKLAGEVRVAAQQLRLAAQMAAVTGETGWIERFDAQVPMLAQTIEHASLLAPPDVAQAYRNQTQPGSALLGRMHRSALDALNSGAAASARALLDSPRYAEQTRLLRNATEELTAASLAATGDEVRALRQRSYVVAGATLALALGLGFTLWRRLTSGLNRSRGSLLDAEVRVQRLAASDLLTGLDNRAALHDAMHTVMRRARHHGEDLALLMVDLDRFKPVNDRHGHMVGDLVLKEVAQRLARCLRHSDLRARYGGDEFVVLVDEREGPGTAHAAAQRIVDRLSLPMQFGDLSVSIGASVGIARFPADAISDDELLRKADSALYRAKQEGRGGVCMYDATLDESLSERDALEQALRAGIAAGELVPFYSSLSYLAEMTFDKIKIDRSFVRTLRDRPESAKIVDAIVGLSRSLGVETVAEGVETEAQAQALQQLGCFCGQGYLFGRPVRAQDLADRITLATNVLLPMA